MNETAFLKFPLLSFASSVLALSLIFAFTSYKHYGHLDLEYYQGILIQVLVISLLPALLVAAAKTRKWHLAVGIGVLGGFTGAVANVALFNNI